MALGHETNENIKSPITNSAGIAKIVARFAEICCRALVAFILKELRTSYRDQKVPLEPFLETCPRKPKAPKSFGNAQVKIIKRLSSPRRKQMYSVL